MLTHRTVSCVNGCGKTLNFVVYVLEHRLVCFSHTNVYTHQYFVNWKVREILAPQYVPTAILRRDAMTHRNGTGKQEGKRSEKKM